jgi:hypothetical protein
MSSENPTKLANMMKESHIIPDQVEQTSHNGDCNNDKMVFDYSKTLAIAQSPMAESDIKKTPKKRGRKPKSSKTREEIEAGLQATLEDTFTSHKRSLRRTVCSPRLQ